MRLRSRLPCQGSAQEGFPILIVALLAAAPAAGAAKPSTVALDYVRDHPESFRLDENDVDGLRLADTYRSGSGAVHLRFEQYYRGVPVFGPGLHANVDRDGQLINIGGAAQPDPHVDSITPRLPALTATARTIFRDRLAWRVIQAKDSTHVYDTVIDATTGRALSHQPRARGGRRRAGLQELSGRAARRRGRPRSA